MSWAINGEAVSMDYAMAYDFNTNVAVTNITEPLLRFSPEGAASAERRRVLVAGRPA